MPGFFGGGTNTVDDSGIDLTYGIGGQYELDEKMTVGAEYMIYNFDGGDVTSLAVNVAIKF